MSVNTSQPRPFPMPDVEIVGPWSPWPRKRKLPARKHVAAGATVAAAAVFAHCIAPLL